MHSSKEKQKRVTFILYPTGEKGGEERLGRAILLLSQHFTRKNIPFEILALEGGGVGSDAEVVERLKKRLNCALESLPPREGGDDGLLSRAAEAASGEYLLWISTVIPVETADLWLQRAPQADLEVFEGSGNLPHLEEPAAFVASFKRYLERRTEPALPID